MLKILRNWLNHHFSDPQVVILGFLLFLGFLAVFMLGDLLTPVIASLVIAYLLEGMVAGLQRLKIPHIVSVLIVFLLFMASVLIILIVLLPLLSKQIGQLLQQLPSMIGVGQKELMRLPERYPDFISESQIKQLLNFISSELTNLAQHILSISLASVRGAISILVYLILVPLLVFFFLKDKKLILEWITTFLPEDRGMATEVWQEVNRQTANYVRGKIWEIIIVWGASYITFKLLNLQFAMLLALFVGLSVLVPYIGATVMFLPVALIAYFQWGWGSNFATALIAYTIIQALDGNLLVPLLLSGVVNLHPIAIIVAVLIFGGLWGLWGLFFAIPLATLIHAVIKVWLNKTRQKEKPE
ncbi:MAG: AI-2E family transporter [Desulfobacterales bacterium]|nr:AI-2E family transporter [Desulfobacterales bacterium]